MDSSSPMAPTIGSGDGARAVNDARLEEIGFQSLWKNPTGGEIRQAWCVGGNVYVVRPGTDQPYLLERLDGETGLTVWTFPLQVLLDHPPRVYSYPAELRAMNPDEVYILQEDELIGIDDRFGAKNFGVSLQFPASTAPVPGQDHIFVGSWNRRLYAISKKTRLEQWSYITDDSITAEPIVGPGNVYFGSEDQIVYSLTRAGGYVPGRSWALQTGARISAPALIYGDRIFVGSHDYKTYCLEDVGAEAYIRWAYPCGAPVVQRPFAFRDWIFSVTQESRSDGPDRWNLLSIGAVRGDLRWEQSDIVEVLAADALHVYALDTAGNVRAIRLEDGAVDWTLSTSGYATVLGQDARLGSDKAWWGRMFLISSDGTVQAIRPRR